MLIFFDTETTGLIRKDLHFSDERQPSLVQLAFIVTTDEGEEVASFCSLVKQDKPIPAEATAIHGKTDEMCAQYGLELAVVLPVLTSYLSAESMFIGFNVDYDHQIIAIAHEVLSSNAEDWFIHTETFCVMKPFTDICKLPGKYGKYKWPKLKEAYEHAFGKEFDNQHDALADVRATKELYFWLTGRALTQPQPIKEEKIEEKHSYNIAPGVTAVI